MSLLDYELLIRSMGTPNPNAIKFIINGPFKNQGKATFNTPSEAVGLVLIESLFSLPEVQQVHLFENVMTVTFNEGTDVIGASENVESIIKTRMPMHDPNFVMPDEKIAKKVRDNLSPELLQIEEILDRTIRPGLQSDGGDLDVVSYEDHLLTINYQGACGTCPSSMYGTLDAIQSILQNEFDPALQVTIG
jgi:NFU1 iron-sulfur cluster scaffold homolog, mitochondrial